MRFRAVLSALLAFAAVPAAAQTHPFARPAPLEAAVLNGAWNGTNLERRSNCSTPQNNGSRGTYAEFFVDTNAAGDFVIAQRSITGLNCEYRGRYEHLLGTLRLQGTYTCTDGKQGAFTSDKVVASAGLFHVHFATQLTGSESCSIEALLSMARHAP